MRVLSIQQPTAHLVVRNLQHAIVKSWGTDFRGRIAIQASSAVPSKEIEKEWTRDERTARVFADQGWSGRNDLKDLPRGAIIGTVELRSVNLGKALHGQNARQIPRFDMNEALYAALGRVGGGFGWNEPRIEPVPVVIPDDQYAWTFAHPVAIEPIEDVMGQQHLWNLTRELSKIVEEREARMRAGEWRPPAINPGKRRRAMIAWEREWNKVYDELGWRLLLEAYWEVQVSQQKFDDPDFEGQFVRSMQRWTKHFGVAVPGRGLHIRVEPHLRSLFGGRDLVRALEFEATVREDLERQMKSAEEEARAERYHRQLVDLIRELKEKAARKPISDAEIRTRVKNQFKRLVEEAVEREMGELGV